MRREILFMLICLMGCQHIAANPVTDSQARKFSMTTRMFLKELDDGGFDPVKQEARRKARMKQHGLLKPETLRRSKNDGRFYAAPDTINGRAYVSAFITLEDNNDVSALEALGVQVQCKFNDGIITSEIPVDKINDVAAMSDVKRISVARILKPCTNHGRMYTNTDDILTLSADALRAGIDNKYDGKGVLLGIIDTGIDFQHIAFKDKDGNSRIVGGYMWNGKKETDYNQNNINSATTDDKTMDHGTHTASTAGGSSVIIDGNNVVVTDEHANATYGGMAPNADLFLCGICHLEDTYIANAFERIISYADSYNQPVVVSNSWGGMQGPRDGSGEFSDILNSFFNSSKPNHICLFSSGNSVGNSYNGEGGGIYVSDLASKNNPLGTIIRGSFPPYYDGGFAYCGQLAYACPRFVNGVSLECKLYVLNNSTGEIIATIPITESGVVSGLHNYYYGDLYVEFENNDTGGVLLYTKHDVNDYYSYEFIVSKSTHTTTKNGNTYNDSDYTLAFEVYPKNGNAVIDMWGEVSYFTNHLRTDDHNWIAGSDDFSVGPEVTIKNTISVGAYVTRAAGKDYKGDWHLINDRAYSFGDIAPFSSYTTAEKSLTGEFYPWITAPGALVISAVNSFNESGNYLKDNFDEKTYRVNSNKTYPYGTMEGTSMSCPVVAGIVALWLQAAKEKGLELTTSDVKQIMAETAIKDEFVTGANSTHFGNGKIDALAGLIKVLAKANVVDNLSVTNLELIDGDMERGLIDGTSVRGTVYIKNNDTVIKNADVIIGLTDVETPQATKTNNFSVSIAPNTTVGYNFSFDNLTDGHHYVITVSYANGTEFYQSSQLLCTTNGMGEVESGDQALTAFEYWCDGNISSRQWASLSGTYKVVNVGIDATQLDDGIHKFSFRVRQSDGKYSAVSSSLFLKTTPGEATRLEYWVDGDITTRKYIEGQSVSAGGFMVNDYLDLSGVTPGVHRLFLRGRSADNKVVSAVTSVPILVKRPMPEGNKVVYWIDDNVDQQESISFDNSSEVNSLDLDLSDYTKYPVGFHRLNMKLALQDKGESAILSDGFFKSPAGQATRLEYWLDGDYKNTSKSITGQATDGEYIFNRTLDLNNVTPGAHRLFMRGKSSDNKIVSATTSAPIMVKSRYNPERATMESYMLVVDKDSIASTGPMSATNEAELDYTLNAGLLAEGTHTLKYTFWNSFGRSVTDESSFWVSKLAAILGDVNNDGQVGIGDIVAVTNVMAGITTDSSVVARADVHGDGQEGIGERVARKNITAGG